MLKELSIRGLAVVKELSLEFGPGLNVLTGETGAGKSIIAGAIGLLIGEKRGPEIVRTGESVARTTGVFDVGEGGDICGRLDAMGVAGPFREMIVKREITEDGRSRAYVNGEPVPVGLLKRIGDLLIDFHGQHEHQSLLKKSTHVELLDSFGGLHELRNELRESCAGLRDARGRLERFVAERREALAQIDFTRFQASEIEGADLKEGEEESLEDERRLLQNFEKLSSSIKDAGTLIYEDEVSCVEQLSRAIKALRIAGEIDARLRELEGELASAQIAISEAGRTLSRHLESVEYSPERLDEVETRLSLIGRLKKKYGRSVSEILRLGAELRERLSLVETGSEGETVLRAEIEKRDAELGRLASDLLERRRATAVKLEREVQKELGSLGMKGTRFAVEIVLRDEEPFDVLLDGRTVRIGPQGPGEIQYLISPNLGEELRPLVRIASGGEISRIMLALKTVFINADEVDLMVFDEIDVGIGGKVARVVGEKLKALSGTKQIICITHIPMIACLGDTQFLVSKETEGGRTYGTARALTGKERVEEIARMLAGDKISQVTLKQAREMLDYGASEKGKEAKASVLRCARSSAG